MAEITSTILEGILCDPDVSDENRARGMFAINHVEAMARELREQYYLKFESAQKGGCR